jgi:phosphatidylglycerol---prolipoprotein diacylglyceryl transferase
MYPVLVQFGWLGLRTLPAVWALGIWAGVKVAAGGLRRRGLDPEWAHEFLAPAAIAGLVGARLFHVLVFDPRWFATHPRDVLSLWSGLAFPGALLAGWGAALWFCRRRGIGFWAFADAAVIGVALGQAIGALGSFLNGSGYGTPTAVPWAVVFHDPRGQAPLGVPVHPTQLYEALAFLVLFGGLWMARRVRRDGVPFLLYLVGAVGARAARLPEGGCALGRRRRPGRARREPRRAARCRSGMAVPSADSPGGHESAWRARSASSLL